MSKTSHSDGELVPAPGTDLAALIAAEMRMSELLDAAREQAKSIVDAARARVKRVESDSARDIAAGQRAVDDDVDAAMRDRIAVIERDARARIAAYDAVTGERLDAIARRVVELLLARLEGGA